MLRFISVEITVSFLLKVFEFYPNDLPRASAGGVLWVDVQALAAGGQWEKSSPVVVERMMRLLFRTKASVTVFCTWLGWAQLG